MEDTKHIKISEFNYPLPDERIAKFPLAAADQTAGLPPRRSEQEHLYVFATITESGELMIFNNAK